MNFDGKKDLVINNMGCGYYGGNTYDGAVDGKVDELTLLDNVNHPLAGKATGDEGT